MGAPPTELWAAAWAAAAALRGAGGRAGRAVQGERSAISLWATR